MSVPSVQASLGHASKENLWDRPNALPPLTSGERRQMLAADPSENLYSVYPV